MAGNAKLPEKERHQDPSHKRARLSKDIQELQEIPVLRKENVELPGPLPDAI